MANLIALLGKLRNILAAVIGTGEVVLPLVKELIVDVLRISDLILAALAVPLPFLKPVSDKLDSEPAIKKINEIYAWLIGAFENVKNEILVIKVIK